MNTMLQNSTYNKTLEEIRDEPYEPSKRGESVHRGGLRGAALKKYLEGGYKLSKLQKSVLVGSLLGDGSLGLPGSVDRSKPQNVAFKFDQSYAKREYVYFMYKIFKDIVGTPPQIRYKDKKPHSVWFRTYRIPAFNFYRNQFYEIDANGNRRKKVPKLIHRWLDTDALAIWYQDDGTRHERIGYALASHCFYLYENKILQKALSRNFGFAVSIRKDSKTKTGKTYYYLGILKESEINFTRQIQSKILPVMNYKLQQIDSAEDERMKT